LGGVVAPLNFGDGVVPSSIGGAVVPPSGTSGEGVVPPSGTFGDGVVPPSGTFGDGVVPSSIGGAVVPPSGTFGDGVVPPSGTFGDGVVPSSIGGAVVPPSGTGAVVAPNEAVASSSNSSMHTAASGDDHGPGATVNSLTKSSQVDWPSPLRQTNSGPSSSLHSAGKSQGDV
jgi:hypothetical protein